MQPLGSSVPLNCLRLVLLFPYSSLKSLIRMLITSKQMVSAKQGMWRRFFCTRENLPSIRMPPFSFSDSLALYYWMAADSCLMKNTAFSIYMGFMISLGEELFLIIMDFSSLGYFDVGYIMEDLLSF